VLHCLYFLFGYFLFGYQTQNTSAIFTSLCLSCWPWCLVNSSIDNSGEDNVMVIFVVVLWWQSHWESWLDLPNDVAETKPANLSTTSLIISCTSVDCSKNQNWHRPVCILCRHLSGTFCLTNVFIPYFNWRLQTTFKNSAYLICLSQVPPSASLSLDSMVLYNVQIIIGIVLWATVVYTCPITVLCYYSVDF